MDSLRLEESLKVKRKRNVYKFIKTFDSILILENHQMDQQYWACQCGNPACDLAWKINKCDNEGICFC